MDAAALKALGNAQFAAGEYEASIDSYSKALDVVNSHEAQTEGMHLIYGNRAAAALKLGRWVPALQDSEAALAVEPRWAKALFRKASALQGLGRTAAAAAAAQQALQAEPGNKDVQALLRRLQRAVPASGEAAAGGGVPSAVPRGSRKPAFTAAMLPRPFAGAPWEYVPSADGIDENLLLLLHGLGDRPAAFAALARKMALPQTAALALGGPQEVPFSDGGRSWYTVFTEEFEMIQGRPEERRRVRSLQQTVSALQQLLGKLESSYGYQPRCIHVLGFSQGGTVALELARQQQACGQPLGSCVAVSAALLPEQLPELQQLAAQQAQQAGRQQQQQAQQQQAQEQQGGGGGGSGIAGSAGCAGSGKGASTTGGVLITRGTQDTALSQPAVDETAAALRALGVAVECHSVPGKDHAMPQGEAEMRQLMQYWAKRLSRRPTAADLPAETTGEAGDLIEIRPGEVSVERVEDDGAATEGQR